MDDMLITVKEEKYTFKEIAELAGHKVLKNYTMTSTSKDGC